MKKQYGITLLELMVVITLVGILGAMALPSMTGLLKNNRLTAQANSLIGMMQYARNEAINRGHNIVIQPLVAGTNWAQGWQVRLDVDSDGDYSDAADVVIRNSNPIEGGTLVSDNATIVYEPTGFSTAKTILTLTANECTGEHIRTITLKISGYSKVTRSQCP